MWVTSINIPAGDGDAKFTPVSKYWRQVAHAIVPITIREGLKTFINIPAIIFAAIHQIDFLITILADVAHPKFARERIKRKTPRLAKPECPNFWTEIGSAHERIIGRNPIRHPGRRMVHIDPQYFAEEQRSEEHTSELQSHSDLVCRLLL